MWNSLGHGHGHKHDHGHGHHGREHHGHGHGHDHGHGHGHDHSHGHDNGHAHSHGHGHEHSHGHDHAHGHGHGHAHSHGHGHGHDHGHGHGHGHSVGEAEMAQQSLVAVAIDKDKGSQNALKWTMDHLVSRGQTLLLVHVLHKGIAGTTHSSAHSSASSSPSHSGGHEDGRAKEVFLPFRCFCSLKQVNCQDVVLEDQDVAKAIIEFVSQSAIEKLVVGHSSKHGFVRFKVTDIPTSISKGAPDFCTVYIIQKGKVSSVRHAVRHAPTVSPFRQQIQNNGGSLKREMSYNNLLSSASPPTGESFHLNQHHGPEDRESIKSPFTRGGKSSLAAKSYGELTMSDHTDISFVSSGRPSTDNAFSSLLRHSDGRPPRLSTGSDGLDRSFELVNTPAHRTSDGSAPRHDVHSAFSQDSDGSSWSMEDVETEMRRLRLELKQTMDMYSTACKEALNAKQKARELHRWKMEEEQRLQEARLAEETALAVAESEKAKCKAAIEAAEASQRIAQLEAQKRISAEMKALKESEEKKRALDALAVNDMRCRKYAIEDIEVATEYFSEARKIGEGGYGPVYRCHLDHTPVAIKVLRPDAAQGRSQFEKEVEVLSCIRHPNMVLLLGACPEYGCLVYEYMANGSLDDRLFRRGNTPVLPWQLRFRIAAEIGTGLLFLHQTKPEPLVHRDLKPANILLDNNYVSKIGDVGLARLVPPSVADNVTQYRVTSTAGTFCYIDPEYQQTGMLGIKSDIYSLGIMLLQLITARPPMGLTHHVERAIENGTFGQMLDPAVQDWPVEAALRFAKMALMCSELRRKDRPDLGTVVLPELERLRELAEEQKNHSLLGWTNSSAKSSQITSSMTHDVMSDPLVHASHESIKGRSSAGRTVI